VLLVVIGITYGSLIGLLGNWLLFRKIAENRRCGLEPLKGIGAVFFLRYAIDLVSLLIFGYITKNGWAIVAAAVSITVAVKISLYIVYAKKGGRF
jgi:hypothetical protein